MTSGWLLAGTRWSKLSHSWFSGSSSVGEMLPQLRFNTPALMFPISPGAEHHRTCKLQISTHICSGFCCGKGFTGQHLEPSGQCLTRS